jgi:hypothetical protein
MFLLIGMPAGINSVSTPTIGEDVAQMLALLQTRQFYRLTVDDNILTLILNQYITQNINQSYIN